MENQTHDKQLVYAELVIPIKLVFEIPKENISPVVQENHDIVYQMAADTFANILGNCQGMEFEKGKLVTITLEGFKTEGNE